MLELLRAPWRVEPADRWPGLFDVYDRDGGVIAAAKIEEVARIIARAPIWDRIADKLTLCPDCGELWPVTETIRADGSLGCPCQEG